MTFGKALGCHGAAILGSNTLIDYLINFSRSFIYTTALPPHSVASVIASYNYIMSDIGKENIKLLHSNIGILQLYIKNQTLIDYFIPSNSAIHSFLISGNDAVKNLSNKLDKSGFDVKPILSPTVPEKKERLRICLHSFNTQEEIEKLVTVLATFVR